jgi:hypothetical protein
LKLLQAARNRNFPEGWRVSRAGLLAGTTAMGEKLPVFVSSAWT